MNAVCFAPNPYEQADIFSPMGGVPVPEYASLIWPITPEHRQTQVALLVCYTFGVALPHQCIEHTNRNPSFAGLAVHVCLSLTVCLISQPLYMPGCASFLANITAP